MIIDHADAAEIGATAAGVLVSRHGQQPSAFGLQWPADSQLAELKLPGFRYGKPEDAERVRQWWKQTALKTQRNLPSP